MHTRTRAYEQMCSTLTWMYDDHEYYRTPGERREGTPGKIKSDVHHARKIKITFY